MSMKQKLNFNSIELDKILTIFSRNNADIRIIGGAVRDNLLSKNYSDIDLATTLLPLEVTRIFKQAGFTVIPTGIDFGTVTILSGKQNFQITTLRKDVSTDGRHAIVEYTNDYKIDASRRDFTINALSYDPFSEKLYDYFNGLDDLKNSIVRFIGIPSDRIIEDHLRIMRFFRFSAYYTLKLDKDGLDACKSHIHLLEKISKERIHQEFTKLLMCKKNISNILSEMVKCKLLHVVFKDITIDSNRMIVFESKLIELLHLDFDIKTIRLSVLTYQNQTKETEKCLKELKFSNNEIKTNSILCNFIKEISKIEEKKEIVLEICKFWYYNYEKIRMNLIIAYLYNKNNLEELETNIIATEKEAPKMPVKTEELILNGFEGLALGVRIKFLEKKWIESGFSAGIEELIKAKF